MKNCRLCLWISAFGTAAGVFVGSMFLGAKGQEPSTAEPIAAAVGKAAEASLNASAAPADSNSGLAVLASAASQHPPRVPPPGSTNSGLVETLRAGAAQVLVQDHLSPHQIGVRELACQESSCQVAFQLPPFVDASVRHDSKVASDLLEALRGEYGKHGAQVGLTRLEHTREGMAIAFKVDAATEKGRYLSDSEIARLRAETIQAYLASQKK